MPIAEADSRSDCSAIRFRSRQVSCMIGSTPAASAARLPAQLASRTVALWLSVIFTASTQPRSSAALRRMGPASAPRGGPSSAVTANRPAASVCRSPAVPGPPGLLPLLTRCSFPRSPLRHATPSSPDRRLSARPATTVLSLAAPYGTQLHLPPPPPPQPRHYGRQPSYDTPPSHGGRLPCCAAAAQLLPCGPGTSTPSSRT